MEKQFQYQSSTIYYRIEGSGKSVVLIHGFGEDSSVFNAQIDFLKNHCQLIVPNLPGTGKSELLQLQETVTIQDYANCIAALIHHENIDQCIMLGHSMGGYITLAFAKTFPELLTGFGLIHSTAFADTEEKKQNRLRSVEIIEQYNGHAFLKTTIPNLFGKNFKQQFPEKVEALIESSKQFSKASLKQYTLAMMNRNDSVEVLRNNPLPVLFIIGTEDIAAPLNDVMQQTYLPQCSYIHVLKDVGHMGMLEATNKVNKYLLEFIIQ